VIDGKATRIPIFGDALKEAAITAAVATALMIPLVGLHAKTQATGLVIDTRFGEVAIAVVLIFLGRYVLVLTSHAVTWPAIVGGIVAAGAGWMIPFPNRLLQTLCITGGLVVAIWGIKALFRSRRLDVPERDSGATFERQSGASLMQKLSPWVGAALILFAVVLPLMPFADRRVLDLATLILIYVMLGWGLNIVVGLAGLLDLGYVAFYAVGAYSFALLFHNFELSFWMCLPIAGVLAAFVGIILGFPVLRLRGDYLAIVTLGFGEMIRVILINWVPVTRGPDGISGIPKPTFFGLPFKRRPPEGVESFHQFFDLTYSSTHRIIFLFYVALIIALLINAFILRIRKMPIGRAWEAMREDEIACRALGLNPTNIKLSAFALGAMFGGVAGTVFATRQSFISPESFTFIESAIILAVVVLGGMGSQIGVVIAAVVLIGLPEWFREIQEYRMLAFGAMMVLIMIWRPRGLLSYRVPTIGLKPEKAGGEA
jgi:branched-chain amino acid transport system permease protein